MSDVHPPDTKSTPAQSWRCATTTCLRWRTTTAPWPSRSFPFPSATSSQTWTPRRSNRSDRCVDVGIVPKRPTRALTLPFHPQAIITLILATDMAKHGEILDSFKRKLDGFDFTSEEHVTCVCSLFKTSALTRTVRELCERRDSLCSCVSS